MEAIDPDESDYAMALSMRARLGVLMNFNWDSINLGQLTVYAGFINH